MNAYRMNEEILLYYYYKFALRIMLSFLSPFV